MSIKQNYIYNLLYQILLIILPIITMPYITRVFSPSDLGINSFTAANTEYFIVLATLGISLYANRKIASHKDSQIELDRSFWAIFFLKLITTTISIGLFIVFLYFFGGGNQQIYLIQMINIIAVALDISWLFIGLEDFKKIVIRNTTVKLLGIALIFIFVKESNDLVTYIFILAITNLLGATISWLYIRQYIEKFYFEPILIISQMKPTLKLFLPQVITIIYVILDKTMLGILSTEFELGIYEMSQKIIKIVQTMITSLGVVMIPRIAYLFSKEEINKINIYMKKGFIYMAYIAVPMTFGLSVVSRDFSLWFFGKEFEEVGNVLAVYSFVLLATTGGYLIGLQYLVPAHRERDLTISYSVGAILNFILNIFLIRKYGSMGAICATILTEFTVTGIQLYMVRHDLDIKSYFREIVPNLFSAIIMVLVISFINISNSFTAIIFKSLVGVVVYTSSMYLLKSSVQDEVIKIILSKFNFKLHRK